MFSSQLAELHSDGASVRSLQGAVQALEQDKKHLEERAESLEKDLAAAKHAINLPSGKCGLVSFAPGLVPSCDAPHNNRLYVCPPGDAVVDQLREDKETAESQVCMSGLGPFARALVSFVFIHSPLNRFPALLAHMQPHGNGETNCCFWK